tara:strand:- start:200 stop:571 length:372 start_codon:yes stop_codon:yes gene_type:complete
MSYLAKLKQLENSENLNNISQIVPPKPPKGDYGSFGSTNTEDIEKNITDIAEIQTESYRQEVLSMLESNPNKQRAHVVNTETDTDNVILTIAIRGLAIFEMTIPHDKYDPFLLMELIDKGATQ